MLEQESDFLVYLEKCPYIIKVEGFETDEDSAMMLTQYANGGDLYNYINLKNESGQKITIKEFDNLFRQLIVAVNCFHSLGIYNRDIKPENIVFLDEKQTQLAIIDFGLAIKSDTDNCYRGAGTPASNAPEVNDYRYTMFDCSKADIFSLGKVLEFLFKLLVNVYSVYYVETEELIKKMLDEDPKTRISLRQAIETYNSFSAKKIEVVKNEDEQDDFIVVFKAKKSIKKSKQNKRKSLSKQNKRKSPQKNHSKIKKSKKLI
jgi:serine/threonine protein kinase